MTLREGNMKSSVVLLITAAFLYLLPAQASQTGSGFQGIEFFGSSLISRLELEKALGLKLGASHAAVVKGAARLQKTLDSRHIKANVDIAKDGAGEIIAIDIMESGAAAAPTRKLSFPRHVALSTEVPFQLLDEMLVRRELMAQQGRPVAESYLEGVKRFSDEPCNVYADKLMRRVPDMVDEMLSVVASDTDPTRRSKAIEVLNWGGDYPNVCHKLLPAINDSSEQVRASAARFIYPRIRMLPQNFPFEDLVESFSQQLQRPSHFDRLLALRCLTETASAHPGTLYAIKEFDLDRLRALESMSVLDSVKQPAHQLVQALVAVPEPKKAPAPINEF